MRHAPSTLHHINDKGGVYRDDSGVTSVRLSVQLVRAYLMEEANVDTIGSHKPTRMSLNLPGKNL